MVLPDHSRYLLSNLHSTIAGLDGCTGFQLVFLAITGQKPMPFNFRSAL
jgi:hypothetical protein